MLMWEDGQKHVEIAPHLGQILEFFLGDDWLQADSALADRCFAEHFHSAPIAGVTSNC
jgi:hypothetical protein